MAAIRKDEVAKTLSLLELQQCEEFERKINEMLAREYGNRTLTFSVDGITPRLKNLILKNYGAAGWKVEFHRDQHDGDYIQFS